MEEPKPIDALRPTYESAMDLRGEPIEVCVCGGDVWLVKCKFDSGEIALYFLDMECASCGSLATAPIPLKGDN